MPIGISAAGWAAIGTTAIGAISANQQSKAASSAASAQAGSQLAQDLIAMQQQTQANEQWNRYKSIYAPLEDSFAAEAQNRGSIANQNKAAGNAAASTTAQYATARERLSKTPGLSPSSQRYLQEMNKINLAEAASSATGQNNARDRVIEQGDALRADALNVGRGMPAQAASGLAGAAGTYGASARAYGGMADTARQQAGQISSGVGNMLGGITSSKGFQNWLSGLGGGSASTVIDNGAANGFGNTFQQNGFSADVAYG